MKHVFVVLKKGWEWSEIVGIYENNSQAKYAAKQFEKGKMTSGNTLDKYSHYVVEKHSVLLKENP